MPAPDGEGAAVPEDELDHRVREELRLGHEAHLPPDEDPGEEVVPLAEVVRGEDHGAARRNVLGGDGAQPVEEHARRREDDSRQVVDPVRLARAGALVEAVEVLRGAGVLVDLWLEVGHNELAGMPASRSYPAGSRRLRSLRCFESPGYPGCAQPFAPPTPPPPTPSEPPPPATPRAAPRAPRPPPGARPGRPPATSSPPARRPTC